MWPYYPWALRYRKAQGKYYHKRKDAKGWILWGGILNVEASNKLSSIRCPRHTYTRKFLQAKDLTRFFNGGEYDKEDEDKAIAESGPASFWECRSPLNFEPSNIKTFLHRHYFSGFRSMKLLVPKAVSKHPSSSKPSRVLGTSAPEACLLS
jgi:hypothetical protein